MSLKWDNRYLALAEHISCWSKDQTKVGAVIVDTQNRVISTGFNGLPRNISDTEEIYAVGTRVVLHAETNAILFAKRDLSNCTMYVSMPTCALCAAHIIQAGIAKVVVNVPKLLSEKWKESSATAKLLYTEAGIIYEEIINEY